MFTDKTLKVINDDDAYTGPDGTFYPAGWDKSTIQGLYPVTLTAAPTDLTLIVTGFIINSSHTQVWQTSAKPLSGAQATQVASLRDSCSATILGGYTSSALGSVYNYPSLATDQMNMAASVSKSLLPSAAGDATYPFYCQDPALANDATQNGGWALRTHTATQIQQAGADAYSYVLTQIVKLNTLSAQVMTAQTVSAVLAITW